MQLKRNAYRTAKAAFRRLGFDLTRRHFYSPIPQQLPSDWDLPRPMPGVAFDLDRQLEWVTTQLKDTASEFLPPIDAGTYRYVYENGSFGHGDANVLYGVLRSSRPRRVVEIGSGHSSVIIRLALERNRSEGAVSEYQAYDPHPTDHLAGTPLQMSVDRTPAERLPDRVFTQLRAGDVLFIDSTHTVRIDNDVLRLVLEGLPLLESGVLIHFHDIFLPYHYPRSFFEDNEFYWAEQYLLQAFLAFNRDFEVCAGLHALFRERREQLRRLIPDVEGGNPGSFWLRRRLS
jgi:hypothetical protein